MKTHTCERAALQGLALGKDADLLADGLGSDLVVTGDHDHADASVAALRRQRHGAEHRVS
jgi:hypothetical protein